jgi:hypothetical protein
VPVPTDPFPHEHDWQTLSEWNRSAAAAWADIEQIIPEGSLVILADDGHLGQGPRRSLPFLEHDGLYWGPPADDGTAISELERMRAAGASFFVLAWPVFWWIDCYSRFYDYLRSQFRCLRQNDRLLVFDLTSQATNLEQE